MTEKNPRLGVLMMLAAVSLFALQDGISRHLATNYNTVMIVMIRYGVFALFAVAWGLSRGGLRAMARTEQLGLQILRSLILVIEILVAIQSFVLLGLVTTVTIFGVFPMIVAALSGPLLGERVGWQRGLAILAGFIGILIILRPGFTTLTPAIALPLLSAFLFALYNIATRLVSRTDGPKTSFFWTGIVGLAAILTIGPFWWEPMARSDWGLMCLLAATAIAGHFLLIVALDLAEANRVQPLSYLHVVFAVCIGVFVFGDALDLWTVVGAAVVIAAGVFTLLRSNRRSLERP